MVLDAKRHMGSMGGMTDNAETILLRHLLETPDAAIPEAARDAARVFLLDGLAVGVAGMAAVTSAVPSAIGGTYVLGSGGGSRSATGGAAGRSRQLRRGTLVVGWSSSRVMDRFLR